MKQRVTFNEVEAIVVEIMWLLLGLFLVGFLIWGSFHAPAPGAKGACRGLLLVISVPCAVMVLIGLITWICNLGRK